MALHAKGKRNIEIKEIGFKAEQSFSFDKVDRTYNKSLRFCPSHPKEVINLGGKTLHFLSIKANPSEYKDDCGEKKAGVKFKTPEAGESIPLTGGQALFTSTDLQKLIASDLEIEVADGMFKSDDDIVNVYVSYGTGEPRATNTSSGQPQQQNQQPQPQNQQSVPILPGLEAPQQQLSK